MIDRPGERRDGGAALWRILGAITPLIVAGAIFLGVVPRGWLSPGMGFLLLFAILALVAFLADRYGGPGAFGAYMRALTVTVGILILIVAVGCALLLAAFA